MEAPRPKVLIVDDEPQVCQLLEDALDSECMDCRSAHSVAEAERLLLAEDFDAAVIDLSLPDGDGTRVLEVISRHDLRTRAVCITAFGSTASRERASRHGALGLYEKPFDVFRLARVVRRAADGLPVEAPDATGEKAPACPSELARQVLLEFVRALSDAVEAKDPYTRRHSDHVARYAEMLCQAAGVAEDRTERIRMAALLHDIGKIGVPDHVLVKPGPLSSKELEFIRQHPIAGASILRNISLMEDEAKMVRHHHERWDGRGYPDGLRGEEIPLGARILSIADSMDAMLMLRTYKPAFSVERVIEELTACAGTQFDPDLAAKAADVCRRRADELVIPPGSADAVSA